MNHNLYQDIANSVFKYLALTTIAVVVGAVILGIFARVLSSITSFILIHILFKIRLKHILWFLFILGTVILLRYMIVKYFLEMTITITA